MSRAYRIALICGALPLAVGVSIFGLWLITRSDWLVIAGALTLCCGVAVFLIGAIALGRFCHLAFRTPGLPRRRPWFSTLACAGLLLSNFPAAGGIMIAVYTIATRYTVTVRNASQQPLDGVRVFGGGREADFGTVPPGGVVRRSFWFRQDGELEVRAVSGATKHAKTIDGYVTHNMTGHTTVTFNSGGTISVSNLASKD